MAHFTIRNFRVSFLWTEMLPGMLSGAQPATPEFHFLSGSDTYGLAFVETLTRDDTRGLEPPWHDKRSQRFWRAYLPGAPLPSIGMKQPWKWLVPLRRECPWGVSPAPNGTFTLEGYYYPHAFGFVFTARCSGEFKIDEMVKAAYEIRRQKYDPRPPAGSGRVPLGGLAALGLKWLRESAVGPGAAQGVQGDLFTIFSVTKAEATGSGSLPKSLTRELRRALNAVTSWPADPAAEPPAAAGVLIPLRDAGAGTNVLFARERGRAIWLPEAFLSRTPGVSSVACYHRNLMYGSLQVDSLGGLVREVARDLRGGIPLGGVHSTVLACATNACARLEELFTGDKRLTYRSESLKRQIRENHLADLNELRRKLTPGVPDLA